MSAKIYPFPKPYKNRNVPLTFAGQEEYINQLVDDCNRMIFEKMSQYSISFTQQTSKDAQYDGMLVAESIRSMAYTALNMNHALQPIAREMFKEK